MASLAPAAPRQSRAVARPSADTIAAAALLAAAFLLRWPSFGNPAFHIDEGFYLLVGDRMVHGAIPYVDIWDRKPIGLFLLYAAIRLIGGAGVVPYQIVASLFAGGTAFLIHRLALPVAGRAAAVAAGLLYLVWIETVEGGGGQAPVFYNAFVAGAALCTWRAMNAPEPAGFRRPALAAMALVGIAIQIKYTVLVEGMFFGLLLAWGTLRRIPHPAAAAAQIAALAGTALIPTLLAIGCYAAIGHLSDFWFANFVSIFRRAPGDPIELHARLRQTVVQLLPLAACLIASLALLSRAGAIAQRHWAWFLAGWTVAALIGFASVGAFYVHYMLPLFVPLTAGAAPVLRRAPVGPVIAALALWLPLSHLGYPDTARTTDGTSAIEALAALVPADVDRACLYMADGPPILYTRTHACMATRYVFPDHLVSRIDTPAIGVNQADELARVLATRPRTLVTDELAPNLAPASMALLHAAIARHYRHAGRVILEGRPLDVWVSR